MGARWKIVHRFLEGVDVKNPIKAYRNIAVSFCYDGNRLISIEHALDCDDSLKSNQVITASHEGLKLFWEVLRYRRGILLPDINSVAQKVHPVLGSPPKSTGSTDVSVSLLLHSPIIMPNPEIFSQAPARLFVWLTLTNDAFDSSDAAYAIRNYYMVWEDLSTKGKPDDWPTAAKHLKLTRNFVSHAKVGNTAVLDFIECKLGRRIEQFDPTDRDQQQFISSQRQSARNLIEMELDKLL